LLFNYGFFPQTFESPNVEFIVDNLKFKGDGDPIDVIEISNSVYEVG